MLGGETYRRRAGWLFALSAVCYVAILSVTIYVTEPFLFGWTNNPPEFIEMLVIFSVLVIASVVCAILLLWRRAPPRQAGWLALAAAVTVCLGVLFKGYGLVIVPLASPTLLLAYRMHRVEA